MIRLALIGRIAVGLKTEALASLDVAPRATRVLWIAAMLIKHVAAAAYLVAHCVLLLGAAVALAQVMTPNITPPGGVGQMNPNQGDMTANPPPVQGTIITCQGTGYDFTQACNSQYIVVL